MQRVALLGLLLVAVAVSVNAVPLRFSTAYGDHMVLQRAPQRAVVWGYGTAGATVSVFVNDAGVKPISALVDTSNKWFVTLAPHAQGGPWDINVTIAATKEVAWIRDVLFGDVWVCSGQSNMQMTVSLSYNASDEIAKAKNYPNIRYNTPQQVGSSIPLDEISAWFVKWQSAATAGIGGPDWQWMSATCWFFARNIYDQYKVPLGMIVTSYGGTAVEWWSSPDALKKCNHEGELSHDPQSSDRLKSGIANSELWNAMIVPFLKQTIYGAIWYQGESNAGATNYWCTFPAMVDDWRDKWNAGTKGQTDPTFPFGFVIISTWNADDNAVASLRWQQTARFGYVPNAKQPNYFMANAMDLGSPPPDHDIHPKDKQDVGSRLALAGRAIAYKEQNVYWTGPLIQAVAIESIVPCNNDSSNTVVTLRATYSNAGATGIEVRNGQGFEIQDKASGAWAVGAAVQSTSNSVLVTATISGTKPGGLRYAWKAVPCEMKQCSIYSKSEQIPSPLFSFDLP